MPAVLTDVTHAMRVVHQETFGPVAHILKFETGAEAIAMANDTAAGLAAYLYTRDLSRSWRVSEALETGMVGLDTGLISTPVAPFGGIETSGLGREGPRHGADGYLETKDVCVGR